MKKQFEQFWQGRSPSEQKLLLIWGSAVTCALVYFALISPLYSHTSRLENNIPQLEAQLFAMRSQPALGNVRKSNTATVDLRSAVFQFLSEQHLTADVRSISAERIELRLPDMPAEPALTLLRKLREETAARIVVMRIKSIETDKAVQLVVEMERAS